MAIYALQSLPLSVSGNDDNDTRDDDHYDDHDESDDHEHDNYDLL